MSEEKEPSSKRIIRVALRPDTEKILMSWKAQLHLLYPTFDPSLTDLISWIVERLPALSKREIHEVKARFFDDVKELETLLYNLRKARVNGDESAVAELLSNISIRRKSIENHTSQPIEN